MRDIKTVYLNDVDEKYYYCKHSSGLNVYLIPKELSSSFAIFATKYGAIDNCFKTNNDKEFVKVPDGIAHYLEHKMFENEDGTDTMVKFAKYGANDNAFTSSEMTAYHFQCTGNFKENLEILLDYVTHPYFTPENVEKEQGIIGQEIKMGDDNPGRAIYYGLLDALYQKSNIKIDVLGTIESISQITPELLYSCYNTFYNMSNMVLIVHGNHTMDEILDVCDNIISNRECVEITRKYEDEPVEINQKRVIKEYQISKPLFSIGIKDVCTSKDKKELLHKTLSLELAYDILFGSTSQFYIDNYETGLINRLSCGFDSSSIYSYGYLQGESKDPEKFYNEFVKYVEQIKKDGISKDDFERVKRANYASIVKLFDSSRIVNSLFLYLVMEDVSIEDYLDETKSITLEDVEFEIKKHFCDDMYAMCIVNPIK